MRAVALTVLLAATAALPCSTVNYCYGLLEPNGMSDVPTNVVPLVECSGNPDFNGNEHIRNTVKLQRALYDGGIDDAGFVDLTYERPSVFDYPFRVGLRPTAELAPDAGYELVLLGWPAPRIAGRFHTGPARDDSPPLPPMFFGVTTADAPDASFIVSCGETSLRHITLHFEDGGEPVRRTLLYMDGGIFIQQQPKEPTGWVHCGGGRPDQGWTLPPGSHSFRALNFDVARNASTEAIISFQAECPPNPVADGGVQTENDGGVVASDSGTAAAGAGASDAGSSASEQPESCGCGSAPGLALLGAIAFTALVRRQRRQRPPG